MTRFYTSKVVDAHPTIPYSSGPQDPLYICSARIKLTPTFGCKTTCKKKFWHYACYAANGVIGVM
jgi:hypothetical protein